MRRALICTLAIAACDTSVRVGELRDDTPPADGGPLLPQPDAGPLPLTWRLRAPTVPCSIYSMVEVRADEIFVGCNGGLLYRYDGVHATLAYAADEKALVSLLWASKDGIVWAGAQASYDATAPTQLYRFDGTKWQPFASPGSRIVSIAGADADNVWIATDDRILRLSGASFVDAYKPPAGSGSFRSCTFASKNSGWCVGTNGLAVTWDGTTWTPMPGVPWSAQAEMFGVEIEPIYGKTQYFLYGEPLSSPNGDHECRLARFESGAFTVSAATTPCFTDFDVARRRTGLVTVGFQTWALVSPEAQYGGALAFDAAGDTMQSLCGPAMAFTTGQANTRVGGQDGFLATLIGSGGAGLGYTAANGSTLVFDDVSVAPDGTAWARVEDTTACASVSDLLVRFDNGQWSPVPATQGALSGRGLAAVANDRAYTYSLMDDALLEDVAGNWQNGPTFQDGWSLFAQKPNDVWIAGTKENFGHYDGTRIEIVQPEGKMRQIEQILAVDGDVWLVEQGVLQGDVDQRVVRWSGGQSTETNLGPGLARVVLSAVDASHVWRSGSPAAAWDGKQWKDLPFDATAVWARAANEVYFTTGSGDILRWDGKRSDRVYHGVVGFRWIMGSDEHAVAVGYGGGLTVEMARWDGPTN
jgi:hypothetical protein